MKVLGAQTWFQNHPNHVHFGDNTSQKTVHLEEVKAQINMNPSSKVGGP